MKDLNENLDYIDIFDKKKLDFSKDLTFKTSEEITIKNNYKSSDLEKSYHLNFKAGIAPFLGGPYPTLNMSS